MRLYLEEVIRGVVHQHDESSATNVVDAPGEADEEDCCYMVNDLLFKVLDRERYMGKQMCFYLHIINTHIYNCGLLFNQFCESVGKSSLTLSGLDI